MAIYPDAELELIYKYETPSTIKNRVNLHIAVSNSKSLRDWWLQSGMCSHFYIRKNGTVVQYMDTDWRSRVDYNGNIDTIGVETEGGLDVGDDLWTREQVEAIARLYIWAAKTHNLKTKLATDSRVGITSHGLSWHRLGVPGFMVSDGVLYSNQYRKTCPGDLRINQIKHEVFPLVIIPDDIDEFPGVLPSQDDKEEFPECCTIIKEESTKPPKQESENMSKMVSPIAGTVTSEFSPLRRHPVTGRLQQHAGIDIASRKSGGGAVYAAFAGTVVQVGTSIVSGRTGRGILIENVGPGSSGDGEFQYYGHLAAASVKVGQRVKAGQRIGTEGATGNVTGPHLHFETWNKNRVPYNPRLAFNHHNISPGSTPQGVSAPPSAKVKGWTLNSQNTKNVQNYLNSVGFKLVVDGVGGELTVKAVKAWQTRQTVGGLLGDGLWGSLTQRVLDYNRRLQRSLNKNGAKLVVDGDYVKNGLTARAVRNFQSRRGLVVDGVAGKVTAKALGISYI